VRKSQGNGLRKLLHLLLSIIETSQHTIVVLAKEYLDWLALIDQIKAPHLLLFACQPKSPRLLQFLHIKYGEDIVENAHFELLVNGRVRCH
jgi:hypothetical protein